MLIRAVLLNFRLEEVAIPTRYSEESSSVDIPSSIRYILGTFGALYRALRDQERIEQEYEGTFQCPQPLRRRSAFCAGGRTELLYASNVPNGAPIESGELACTSLYLSVHDDIFTCRGMRSRTLPAADRRLPSWRSSTVTFTTASIWSRSPRDARIFDVRSRTSSGTPL